MKTKTDELPILSGVRGVLEDGTVYCYTRTKDGITILEPKPGTPRADKVIAMLQEMERTRSARLASRRELPAPHLKPRDVLAKRERRRKAG